jgi:very-short-patch-repair endonuclease
VLSRGQALASGLTDAAVRAHLRAGRWQRALPGVYATFTGPLPWPARCWAALLYAGHDAVLSHDTAAALHGLADPALPVHVTVPHARRVARRPQVIPHRCRDLHIRRVIGTPPRTSPAHTVLDLVDETTTVDRGLAVVAHSCQRLPSLPSELRGALEQRTRLRWRDAVDVALADVAAGAHSVLELRYLRDVERPHRLPEGRRQRQTVRQGVRRFTDVAYERFRLAVELDGRQGHEGVDGRLRDARRDNAASLAGEHTRRFGWHDVVGRPCEVAQQVSRMLTLGGWAGTPRACGSGCGLTQ